MFADKRVRWALALMLDPVEISMASYRGAATMTAIAIPPPRRFRPSRNPPFPPSRCAS
jgi:ABC-type transport system substrate-binding protein